MNVKGDSELQHLRNVGMIIVGSVVIALAYNFLLIPHNILSGGVSGIAMMLGIITPFDTGVLNFLLNLPLLILGVWKLGKQFITYTIISVIALSVSLTLIPVEQFTHDAILSGVFGGVIAGVGVGIIFKASGSSGGFDIVAMLMAKRSNFPVGTIISALNAVVVVISGFIFGWDAALNTLVSIYATGKVIDLIHTNHIKLTVTIITAKGDEVKDALLASLYRGLTISEGKGGYTGERRDIVMIVITRYQLNEVKSIAKHIDPHAFINITQTVEVAGNFDRG